MFEALSFKQYNKAVFIKCAETEKQNVKCTNVELTIELKIGKFVLGNEELYHITGCKTLSYGHFP